MHIMWVVLNRCWLSAEPFQRRRSGIDLAGIGSMHGDMGPLVLYVILL